MTSNAGLKTVPTKSLVQPTNSNLGPPWHNMWKHKHATDPQHHCCHTLRVRRMSREGRSYETLPYFPYRHTNTPLPSKVFMHQWVSTSKCPTIFHIDAQSPTPSKTYWLDKTPCSLPWMNLTSFVLPNNRLGLRSLRGSNLQFKQTHVLLIMWYVAYNRHSS